MREGGYEIPEEVQNFSAEEVEETEKPKTPEQWRGELIQHLMESLAGRTVNGRQIPGLDKFGHLPTFESRGNSYITYVGDAMDALPLKDLAALPESQKIIKNFMAEHEFDPDMQEKILKTIKKETLH